ncbi:tyrosine-type recombinase/integrase [Nocardia asteroides]|uniref:tyrosine-type recombinase/integrase n=1 Tax=Nocardia asteroides TaxID=1824 RepID=UPI00343F303F
MQPGGGRGSWRPFLAHLGSDGDKRRRTIKLTTQRRLPRTLPDASIHQIVEACDRLRDRFLIEMLAGTGMRIGEALGLRHEDIDAAGTLVRVRSRPNENNARAKGRQREIPVAPAARGDPRQPRSPHHRSQTRRLARRSRGSANQLQGRQRQTRPDRRHPPANDRSYRAWHARIRCYLRKGYCPMKYQACAEFTSPRRQQSGRRANSRDLSVAAAQKC